MYENWKILKDEIEEKREEYSEVAFWCNQNGYIIIETETHFKVEKIPEKPAPTRTEIEAIRRSLYIANKDPLTCQIESLKDEEQTPEIVAEIEALKIKRAEIVAEIKTNNPYPEEAKI